MMQTVSYVFGYAIYHARIFVYNSDRVMSVPPERKNKKNDDFFARFLRCIIKNKKIFFQLCEFFMPFFMSK